MIPKGCFSISYIMIYLTLSVTTNSKLQISPYENCGVVQLAISPRFLIQSHSWSLMRRANNLLCVTIIVNQQIPTYLIHDPTGTSPCCCSHKATQNLGTFKSWKMLEPWRNMKKWMMKEEEVDEGAHGTIISWGSINGTSSTQKPLVIKNREINL